jgi:hypothetical protein
MDKDKLIREFRNQASTWQAVVGVYVIILGSMALSASMIL